LFAFRKSFKAWAPNAPKATERNPKMAPAARIYLGENMKLKIN
jgi:hypothetical protein